MLLQLLLIFMNFFYSEKTAKSGSTLETVREDMLFPGVLQCARHMSMYGCEGNSTGYRDQRVLVIREGYLVSSPE